MPVVRDPQQPARRARREQPPPAPGTVEVRVIGAPQDVDAYLDAVGKVLPVGRYTWMVRRYEARQGGVRQYVKVNLPGSGGS